MTPAERQVKKLQKQLAARDAECRTMAATIERHEMELSMLARLSADQPRFFNPLMAMAAKAIRDDILSKDTTP